MNKIDPKLLRESHDCFRDALVCTDTKNVIVAFTYICKIRGKLHAHARAREQKFKQNCNLEMLFLFFFFFFLNISLSWCHDNASLAKPRRSLILHVTRALISFEPIFFFFFEKRKRRFNFVDSFDEARNEDCENITTRRICYNWTWLNS